MADHCGGCTEVKKDCRCTTCISCDGTIVTTMFKKKKHFCSRCNISVCGKCLEEGKCTSCQKEKDSNDECWKNACDLDLFITERTKDEKLDEMIEVVKENSVTRLKNLLQYSDKEYLERGDFDGRTLLFHAVRVGDIDMINYLISVGSLVTQLDNRACTLIHHLASSKTSATQQTKGQILKRLRSAGISTFKLNNLQETALSIAVANENLELQDLLEKAMYKESYQLIASYLTTDPDIPAEIYVCLKYIGAKIKILNPFDKKSKLQRNKSLNIRSYKEARDSSTNFNEGGIDPYKLKKSVLDNNDKISQLNADMTSLRSQLIQTTSEHHLEITKLKTQMVDLMDEKDNEILQQRELYNNQLDILQSKLDEAKELEEHALKELEDLVKLKRRYKLCWVPKSVTEKCADVECPRVFRDNYSQHHCRCCGRVFCYDCSIQKRPVPFYGYDTAVRVCRYCYDLLEEEVLCDFDSEDIDEQQWASVHNQSEANTDNLGGKKSMSIFNFNRSRTNTVTSGYDTSGSTTKTGTERQHLTSTSTTCSDPSSQVESESQDPYSSDSESTLSNHSTDESGSHFSETSLQNWKNNLKTSLSFRKSKQNFQRLFTLSKDYN